MSFIEAKSQVYTTGIAKSNQYGLFFSEPTGIISPIETSRRLSISCEECFFPGMNIFTADVRHYGNAFKFPYSREYMNEMTMIFRVGSDMYEKRIFEEWMDLMVSYDNHNHEYYDNYARDIYIAQFADYTEQKEGSGSILGDMFDRFKESIKNNIGLGGNPNPMPNIMIGEETIVYQCMLKRAYPIGMMELPLAHSNRDTYHRIGITFTFRDWQPLPLIKDSDLELAIGNSDTAINDAISASEKRASGGKVVDVATRGGQIYGKIFGRGSGGNIISF